jgi:hypothetical protein
VDQKEARKNRDLFHIDNLVMQRPINQALGETDQENCSEGRHWQSHQSMKDLHERDPLSSQNTMDNVLANTECSLKKSITQERQQQWLANQRNANWNLEAMQTATVDGEPATAACWAKQFLRLLSDSTAQMFAEEVVVFLLKPEIIVASHFWLESSKIEEHFEVTSKWHAATGQLSMHPGFRVVEVHPFSFKLVFPWWNIKAIDCPTKKAFKKTFWTLERLWFGRRNQRFEKEANDKRNHSRMQWDSQDDRRSLLASADMPCVDAHAKMAFDSLSVASFGAEEGVQLPSKGWGQHKHEDSPNRWPEEEQQWQAKQCQTCSGAANAASWIFQKKQAPALCRNGDLQTAGHATKIDDDEGRLVELV